MGDNKIIIHQDDSEITRVSVHFADEDLWLTQNHDIYDTTQKIETLDNQIIANKRKVLTGKGNIPHTEAIEKAQKEFGIYRQRESLFKR